MDTHVRGPSSGVGHRCLPRGLDVKLGLYLGFVDVVPWISIRVVRSLSSRDGVPEPGANRP